MSVELINTIISNAELRADLEGRFWAKVERRGDNECWLWTAKARQKFGYGVLTVKYPFTCTSHRIAFALANGGIEQGAVIRHSCDNPGCCNPRHLLSGTQRDNHRDMMDRGRHVRRPDTPEIRAKIKAGRAMNPPKQSEATRLAKVAEMRRRWQDPDWRARQSVAMTGANNPNYGRTFRHTDEARRKISEAGTARKVSDKTREKMRAAALEREAVKRKARENP